MKKRIAVAGVLAGLLWAMAGSAAEYGATAEDVRRQLFDFVLLQQQLLDVYESGNGPAPHYRRAIDRQVAQIVDLTPAELLALAEADLQLGVINSELGYLVSEFRSGAKSDADAATSPASGSDAPSLTALDAADTAGAPHLGVKCPTSGEVDVADAGNLPPGPCNQTDDIPVEFFASDGSRNYATYRLSDVQYATICPVNTSGNVIVGFESGFVVLRLATAIAKNFCDWEAAGFNLAAACVPFVTGVQLAQDLLEYFRYCNGVRRNADGTAIYTRLGELYVQSRQHFVALGERPVETDAKIDNLQANVEAEVTDYRNAIDVEIDTGFGDIETKMNELESQILENKARADFARLNNDEILREIRIQQGEILRGLFD